MICSASDGLRSNIGVLYHCARFVNTLFAVIKLVWFQAPFNEIIEWLKLCVDLIVINELLKNKLNYLI